ncbi:MULTISPECIES: stressosome-associated protein Prli42 [Bacillaceae]|uniref:Stressosome-associated protein Prli42 n=1 Tax=Niallia endozanthoxylica TaxID=2036016 RepID=A0A5J5HVR8_9BACI|nr:MULTISPECIES: stressosome-associated protein Prli42 [Bacillaceae]KAA9026221.1 stressosome-associated protein Prli42 [Niallia endozanthoxylica]
MSKKRKKTQKIFVYLMIFAMLASTLLAGVAMFF